MHMMSRFVSRSFRGLQFWSTLYNNVYLYVGMEKLRGLVDGEWSVRVEDDVWKTMNMNRDYTFQMTMIKEAQKFKKPYAPHAV